MNISPFFSRKALAATVLAFSLSACSLSIGGDDADEPVAGETVTGQSFDRVLQAGPDKVVITVGKTPGWTIEADADTLKEMRVAVDDGELKIRRKGSGVFNWSSDNGEGIATVRVTMPVLREFSMAGSGDTDIAEMTGESAEIGIIGSGSVKVAKVAVSRLEIDIAGSGDAMLAGSAQNADITIAGSGDVIGEKMRVDRAEVSVAGSGNVSFASDGEVDATIMGSGNVNVSGKAKCKTESMGSGDVVCG